MSPTATGAHTTPSPAAAPQSTRKTLFNTGIGNALEWYDWGIYATFAIYFAGEIFNPEDPVAAILGAMAVFAVGFVFRPLGGFLFGWISDRFGRKSSMVSTVGFASLGSLLIAVVPSYESIGFWAAAILLLARILQGLAHGGEMPTAQAYIAEAAPRERRGKWSSLIYVSGTAGILIGILMGVFLDLALAAETMAAWGWRIPFAVGALMGLWAVIARSTMHETQHFTEERRTDRPRMLPEIRRHWRSALRVIGLSVGGTVCYYVWSVSAIQQAVVVHGMAQGTALQASLLSNLILICTLPFWGALSDRIGRKPLLILGNVVPALLFFPLNAVVGQSFLSLFVPATIMLVFMGSVLAITPAVFSELFPTRIRTIGVAVPYSFAVAIFGGTAPYLQNWVSTTYSVSAFSFYAIALLVVSVVVAATLPETRAKDLRH